MQTTISSANVEITVAKHIGSQCAECKIAIDTCYEPYYGRLSGVKITYKPHNNFTRCLLNGVTVVKELDLPATIDYNRIDDLHLVYKKYFDLPTMRELIRKLICSNKDFHLANYVIIITHGYIETNHIILPYLLLENNDVKLQECGAILKSIFNSSEGYIDLRLAHHMVIFKRIMRHAYSRLLNYKVEFTMSMLVPASRNDNTLGIAARIKKSAHDKICQLLLSIRAGNSYAFSPDVVAIIREYL